MRFKFSLLAREVGGEVFKVVSGGEKRETVRSLLNGFRLAGGAGKEFSVGGLRLTSIGLVRRDIDESRDMRIDSGLGDDRAAVAMRDQNARTLLEIDDALRGGDILLQRGQRFLNDTDVVPILGQDLVDRFPARRSRGEF